ncbi:hypothetical protein QOT17_003196 [Balamuthia mandrillaris]
MKFLLGLLVVFCFASLTLAADLQRLDFALEYQGTFIPSATEPNHFSGKFKAQSQSATTHIRGNGTVNFNVHRTIGSVSVLYLEVNATEEHLDSVTGNLTFGVHTTHNDHTLSFANEAPHKYNHITDEFWTTGCVLHVTSGEGAYEDAIGTITLNAVIDTETGDAIIAAVGILWVDKN